MTLKKKFIVLGIITFILIIVYFIGSHFLKKVTSKEDNSNSNLDTAVDLTGNEYEIKTNTIANYIVDKDFKAIYREFSRDLKKQITFEDFTNNCNGVLSISGKFIKNADILVIENEDSVTAKAFIKYSKKSICVNLLLDLYGKIDSITLDYCTVPTKTDKYKEHYISIGKYSLHGLLTLPNNIENPPVAILVQDKGTIDMDNSVNSNKIFANIAHGLAKKGIAVVRFNKRYSQYSKLAYNEHTIYDDMLDDVNSAIELVKKDKKVDANNIFIIGHGLGGSLASYIANNNENVRGIVSLSGSPRHLADILYDQYICDIGSSNMKDNDKLSELNNVKKDVAKVKSLKKGGKGLILGFNKTFWYSLNKIDIEKHTKNLNIPMLFLQGEDDSLTYADVDFAKWQELLKDNKNAKFILYKDMNHYFINSGKINHADKVKGKVNKKVISDIAKWINENKYTED